MNKALLRSLVASAALVFVLGVMPSAVFAEHGDSNEGSSGEAHVTTVQSTNENDTEDQQTSDNNGSLEQRIQDLKKQREENKQHRLEANKLKVCENRQARITEIMTRSTARAEKQLALFDSISQRVQTFYTQKGRTVANYNDLVAAVNAAKAKAETDVQTLKGQDSFDCNATDPKGDVAAFKLALHTINQDLKDYRTAVKNLIVGVKSAQSTTAKDQGSSEQ